MQTRGLVIYPRIFFLCVLCVFAVERVHADDRPSEADIFGSESASETATPSPVKADLLADVLQIGGQFYLRSSIAATKEQKPKDWSMTSPHMVDLYFDARPNDRVRGMLRLRVREGTASDPTISAIEEAFGVDLTSSAPALAIDQFWINYDWGRRVFVTAGRQHVKWGTGRFWNPTDYLHPQSRDPLAVFDDRVGVNLVKFHIPWEKKGWNFYPVILLETDDTRDALEEIGGAFRTEMLFGSTEIGVDILGLRHDWSRFGADFSLPLGPFDIHGEVGWTTGSQTPLWRPAPSGGYEAYETLENQYAAVAGFSWDWKYSDQDTLVLGFEGFYNSSGYEDPAIYGSLQAGGAFRPFYLGTRYASAFIMVPNPGKLDHTTFVFSTLVNVSDESALSRLDISQQILTHLSTEIFFSGHYGRKGGEFRMGVEIPDQDFGGGFVIPGVHIPVPLIEAGLALRINI